MKKVLFLIIASILIFACNKKEKSSEEAMHKINAYTRDTTSGTRESLFNTVGFGEANANDSVLRDDIVVVSNNADMLMKIKNDKNGIGYVSFSSLSPDVLPLSYEGVAASRDSIMDGSYKLSRSFYWIAQTDTSKEHVDQTQADIVKAFIAFVGSKEGASILENNGVLVKENADAKDFNKDDYPVCAKDNSATTIHFGGSTSVLTAAQALSSEFSSMCGKFVADHNHTGSSDSIKVQDSFHIAFTSRTPRDEELKAGTENGMLGTDAVVLVVNPSNELVKNVTGEQVKKMYTNKDVSFEDLAKEEVK